MKGEEERESPGLVWEKERERGRVWGERENRLEKLTFYTPAQYRADNSLSRPSLLDNRRNQGRDLQLPFIGTLIGPIISYRALLHFVFHDLFSLISAKIPLIPDLRAPAHNNPNLILEI